MHKRKGCPYPWIPRDFVVQEVRGRIAHVEDMPELGKGEGQECDRH